jgi:hypothetical protein
MSTLAEAIAAAQAESRAPVDLHAVSATLDRANRIDLVFVTPLATDYDEVSVQTYALTKALLGERRFGDWIGAVAAVEPARGLFARFRPSRGVPLAELSTLVEGLVERVRGSLPAQAWSARAPQSRVKVKRKPSTGGPPRADIEAGETVHAPLFEAMLDGGSFANERYTRHAERFGYVMAERADAPGLEKRIDRALGDRGATIGWASGTRFAYVDLAFADVPPLDALRSAVEGVASFVALDEESEPVPLTS